MRIEGTHHFVGLEAIGVVFCHDERRRGGLEERFAPLEHGVFVAEHVHLAGGNVGRRGTGQHWPKDGAALGSIERPASSLLSQPFLNVCMCLHPALPLLP